MLTADKLHQEYAYLSRLFSSTEGITIEKFIALQRIEKVKEYLTYNEKNFFEIADEMNYGSVYHLSTQFKKETGMISKNFNARTNPNRKT